MSKPQWTPGPWVVDGVYVYSQETGDRVADLSPWQGPGQPLLDLAVVQANGHLLAAARDMYDALCKVVSLEIDVVDDDLTAGYRAIQAVHAALKKARGES